MASNNVLFSLALPMALVGDAFGLRTAVLLPAYQLAGAPAVNPDER